MKKQLKSFTSVLLRADLNINGAWPIQPISAKRLEWLCPIRSALKKCTLILLFHISRLSHSIFYVWLMIARWWLLKDCPTTAQRSARRLLDDCPTTARQLPDDCPKTAQRLPDNCSKTALRLSYDCPTTTWQQPNDGLTTAWQLPDNCLITSCQSSANCLTNSLTTAWQMPDGCLATVRWLPKDCLTTTNNCWITEDISIIKLNFLKMTTLRPDDNFWCH